MNRRRLSLPLALATLLGGSLAVAAAPASADPVPGKLAVTGTMTGPDGEPLDGTLGIWRRSGSSWSGLSGVLVDQGVVSVALTPGEYRFSFSESSGRYVSEYYADTTNWNAATSVFVNEAAVVLDPIELVRVPAITGRVVDTAGRPVAGAQLQAAAAAGSPQSGYAWTSTSPDGTFRLTPVAGDYRVRVYDYEQRFATEWADDAASHTTARTITLGAADVALGDLTVGAGGAISGTVTDDAGNPLRRIQVQAYDASGVPVSSARSDAAGRYVVPRLTAGDYKLELVDQHGEYATEWYGDAAGSATSPALTVTGTATTSAGESHVTGGPRTAPPGTDATGVVTDTRGRPLVGATVYAYSYYSASGVPRQQVEYTTTGRDGRYYLSALDRVGPTSYKIGVWRSGNDDELGYRPAWYGGGPQDGSGGTGAVVTPGIVTTGLDVSLEQLAGISGTVTDESGRPLEDVDIVLLDSAGRYLTDDSTGRSGRYAFEDVEPGVGHLLGFTSWDGHVPEWYADATVPAEARLVSAGPGAWATADVSLADDLRARTAPAITGTPLVGRRLTASTGRWNLSTRTNFTTQWLRGSTVVGTGSSYVVKAADAGAALTARVRAWAPDYAGSFTGTASSRPTATVRHASTTRVSGKAAGRTVTLAVVVSASAPPSGTVVVTDGRRTVGRVTLAAGRGTLVLRKQAAGKHRYTASYAGTTTVAASVATATVAVRR